MIVLHDVAQGTNKWHALRVDLVTASNAYILLIKGKLAAIGKHGAQYNGSGYWAKRGLALEAPALEVYCAVNDCEVERPGFVTNDEYPDCGWSPDALRPGPRIGVEVKAFKEEKHLACFTSIPPEVYAQCQFSMMVYDNDQVDLVLYNPDIDDPAKCYFQHNIKRDPLLIKRFRHQLGMEQ